MRYPHKRKKWLFCWTEVEAEGVGIVQSPITTCQLHGVDPCTYLVDVLQRIQTHPNRKIEELTPRVWKTLLAANPLRSEIDRPTPTPPAAPPIGTALKITRASTAQPLPVEPVPA